MMLSLGKRCLLEGVGTFLLMFAIALVTLTGQSVMVSAFGIVAMLIAIVFAIGPYTDAQFNPAMSVGFWVRGAMPARELVPYWLAQIGAAIGASFMALLLIDGSMSSESLVAVAESSADLETGPTVLQVLLAETLFTFALVFLTLNVATTRTHAGNQYFGFVIGFTVLAGLLTVGPVASAVFNPAVVFGLWVLGLADVVSGALVILSTVIGASLAAMLFRIVHGTREDGPEA